MASQEQTSKHRPAVGVFWMVVTGFLFVAVTAVVKHGAQELPAAQSAFLRYAIGLLFLFPLIKPIREAQLTRSQIVQFGWRGLAHTFGVILWFFAMTRITVAEVTAMNYMAPIYISIGAALFLGERLAVRRILAIACGFLGALIILRPGFRELSEGHIAMIGTAMFFAVSYLMAKRLSGSVSASVIVGMLSIFCTVGLAPFAIAVWQTPTYSEIGWMAVVAVLATFGHYTMTLAFASAPVTITQPATFLQLIWATLLGYWVFGEAIDVWVLFGGALILASVTFITIREALKKRQASAQSQFDG